MLWLYYFICKYSTFSVKCSCIELSFIKNLFYAYNKVNKFTDNLANKKNHGCARFLMKRKCKQWLSSIPPITTKRAITSRLIEHNKRPWDMRLKIQVLSWDRHKNVADLKHLMRQHPCILISRNVMFCI